MSKVKNFKNWLKSLLGYQPLEFITVYLPVSLDFTHEFTDDPEEVTLKQVDSGLGDYNPGKGYAYTHTMHYGYLHPSREKKGSWEDFLCVRGVNISFELFIAGRKDPVVFTPDIRSAESTEYKVAMYAWQSRNTFHKYLKDNKAVQNTSPLQFGDWVVTVNHSGYTFVTLSRNMLWSGYTSNKDKRVFVPGRYFQIRLREEARTPVDPEVCREDM